MSKHLILKPPFRKSGVPARTISVTRALNSSRLAAQFTHGLDVLAYLAEQGHEKDVVALREDFGGEGAFFVGRED